MSTASASIMAKQGAMHSRLFGCIRSSRADVILDDGALFFSNGVVERTDESPVGNARVRSSSTDVQIAKVKRGGGSWFAPRVFLLGPNGVVVGSAVYRRIASAFVAENSAWVFERPLCAVKIAETGATVVPVDRAVMRAMRMCVR